MLRRLSSSTSVLSSKASSVRSRYFSDTIDSRGPSASNLMCDTADGAYNSMLLSNAANTSTGGKVSAAKTAARPTGSIFGDSPAAVGTSLLGCLCFGATYGYYIGGAVMQATLDKSEK